MWCYSNSHLPNCLSGLGGYADGNKHRLQALWSRDHVLMCVYVAPSTMRHWSWLEPLATITTEINTYTIMNWKVHFSWKPTWLRWHGKPRAKWKAFRALKRLERILSHPNYSNMLACIKKNSHLLVCNQCQVCTSVGRWGFVCVCTIPQRSLSL